MAAYGNWTVQRLRVELEKRGAIVSGRKETLIERLESYDRNDNFTGSSTIIASQANNFSWPITAIFQQLQKTHKHIIPMVTQGQIKHYFRFRLASDSSCINDIKALEKGKLLLESNKILACSLSKTKTGVFFSGLVGAAMKKNVTYNFRIKIDLGGEVVNTDCECPAGKGPNGTCKHVAAVLLMLNFFKESGELNIAGSCTEGLQQFHAPKRKYDGSPVKAENLVAGSKKCRLDDPRPYEFRNCVSYSSHVRNTVLGFCSHSSKDISLKYLYQKADINSAMMDHDYLVLPYTYYWVDEAVKIDEVKAKELERKTRGQSLSRKWFNERQWRLTASKFGDICCMTVKRDKDKLCKSLLSRQILTTRPILHGRQYEESASIEFQKIYQIRVEKNGLFVRPDYPYLGATPDGLVNCESIIEIKCPYNGRNDKIIPGPNFPFLEYNSDNMRTLKTCSKYYMQVQGQLFITKRKFCYFIVYTFIDIFIEVIQYDEDFFTYCMLPKLELFYQKYFRKYIAEHCLLGV